MPHLIVEANDCLRIYEFLRHHKIESSDLIELVLSLFPVQAANLVVQARQTDVRGAVQTTSWFACASGVSTQTSSLLVPCTSVWTVEKPREEGLSIADGDNPLCETVIFIDKVDLLINTKPRSSSHIDLVPRVRRQVSKAHAPWTRHVHLWPRLQESLQMQRVLEFTPVKMKRMSIWIKETISSNSKWMEVYLR